MQCTFIGAVTASPYAHYTLNPSSQKCITTARVRSHCDSFALSYTIFVENDALRQFLSTSRRQHLIGIILIVNWWKLFEAWSCLFSISSAVYFLCLRHLLFSVQIHHQLLIFEIHGFASPTSAVISSH